MNILTLKSASIILALCLTSSFFAQSKSTDALLKEGKTAAYRAYNSYDKDILLKAKTIFETAMKEDSSSSLPLYYITYADYKLLEMNLRSSGDGLFDKYYEEAEKNAEQLSKTNSIESEGKVLLAAVYMMKIANNPMSAIGLSGKILELLDDAEKIDPANPRVYLIRGSMKFNTPKMFGGSYEDAAMNFRKAISLFEKQEQADSLKPSWGYLESMAWLGRAYEQLNNNDSAKFIYQKALSVEPEFGWIKYSLLPNLEKKMAEKN